MIKPFSTDETKSNTESTLKLEQKAIYISNNMQLKNKNKVNTIQEKKHDKINRKIILLGLLLWEDFGV